MTSPSPRTAPGSPAQQRDRRSAADNAHLPYSRAQHFGRILTDRTVKPIFQPIVDLHSREVLGYEALARGPQGTALERPDVLFATARDLGMVGELDWICRAAAMEMAMAAGFDSALTLFVNIEPDVAATRAPEDVFFIMRNAQRKLRVVLEVTERALLDRPAELLHWLSFARDRWWGVALDDVGATSESLALLPFVRPDVVKLDYHLVREEPDDNDKRVLDAVAKYAARTGAKVVAEGIESKHDLVKARDVLGASMGQGWYFGRPGTLPTQLPTPREVVRLLDPPTPCAGSPWDEVTKVAAVQTLTVPDIVQQFQEVEQGALTTPEGPVVLGIFPPGVGPWGTPDGRLTRIGKHACFCGALGLELHRAFNAAWQNSPLAAHEEMVNEWALVVVAPHHAEVVVAFDANERDASGQPTMELTRSTERSTVVAVAELLMRKLAEPKVDLAGRLTS